MDQLSTTIEPAAGAPEPEDVYATWREACEDVAAAYGAWSRASRAHAGWAYAVYLACADREAAAARLYEGALRATADQG